MPTISGCKITAYLPINQLFSHFFSIYFHRIVRCISLGRVYGPNSSRTGYPKPRHVGLVQPAMAMVWAGLAIRLQNDYTPLPCRLFAAFAAG